jgi:hypothetical protein
MPTTPYSKRPRALPPSERTIQMFFGVIKLCSKSAEAFEGFEFDDGIGFGQFAEFGEEEVVVRA